MITVADMSFGSALGFCRQARPAPAKQLDFDGTFHWFEVNIDDLGEPGNNNVGDSEEGLCPSIGFGEKGAMDLANCDCPDFYRITIYQGVDADEFAISEPNKTVVLYEAYGYIDGGNLQIHPLTGYDN